MTTFSGVYWGISCFFAVKFFAIGIYMPFFPLVLAGRGLDAREIAIVMAVSPLLRIATAPWLGSLSDRFRHRKNAVLLYSALAAVLLLPLVWATSFQSILIVTSVSAIFWLSVLPVADAVAVVAAKHHRIRYGRMRLWGSLAFIGANFLAGWVLDLSGPELLVVLIVAVAGLTALAALALPRDTASGKAPGKASAVHSYWSMPALRAIVAYPSVAFILVAAAFGQAAHAMIYAFGTIHWTGYGLSGLEIGAAWGIGVVAEVLLFALAEKVGGRRAAEYLILFGVTTGFIRWGLAPFADGLVAILTLQTLHGVTFGATHLGAMRVIADRLPHDHAGGVLGIYTALTGLAMSGAFAISGPLYQTFAGYGFWAMAILCLTAMMCVLVSLSQGRREHRDLTETIANLSLRSNPTARAPGDKPSNPHI